MGVHYSERKYYDDPIENERFIRYYGATLYCRHGQPSTVICYRCREEQENIKMRKYWDRLNIKYRNFNWNSFFGMESPVADNSTDENEDFKIIEHQNLQEDILLNLNSFQKLLILMKSSKSNKIFKMINQFNSLSFDIISKIYSGKIEIKNNENKKTKKRKKRSNSDSEIINENNFLKKRKTKLV